MSSPIDAWTAARTGLGARLDPESLLAWQLEGLGEVLARARRDSAYYRNRLEGREPRSIRTLEDLDRLPFTQPGALAANPAAFLAVPFSQVERATSVESSGSRGRRKRVFFTAGDLARIEDFFRVGMEEVLGGARSLLVLLSGTAPDSVGRLLARALEGRIDRVRTIGADWDAEQALEAAAGSECIVCAPAQALYLCRTDPGLRPRGLLLSSDYASVSALAAIENTWGLKPLDHYGMTEVGFGLAVQCAAAEGHHLRAPDVFVEVVDPATGARRPDGEAGEIVVTTLNQEAMPLIRYRTGDLGRLEQGPCGCGSVLPRLGRVLGRAPASGAAVSAAAVTIEELDEALSAEPGLRAFFASAREGEGGGRLRVEIDAPGGIDEGRVRSRLPASAELEFGYEPLDPFADRRKRAIVIEG